MRHDVRTGAPLWAQPLPAGVTTEDTVGIHGMTAPAEPEYLPVNVYEPTGTPWALVETETGRVLPGRLRSRGWHLVGAGTFLVGSDHDDPHC